MSDNLLGQQMNTALCVKLGRNVTLMQCSPRFMAEKLWKSQVFLSDINGSREDLIYYEN
jgi:hypothetical protein